MKPIEKERQERILTSLGLYLNPKEKRLWSIELTHLKLFTGLSVLARMIGDSLVERSGVGNDAVYQQKIIPEIAPELHSLGLTNIIVYARSRVLNAIASHREEFHQQLLTVFGTLQRPRWGGLLFPELFAGGGYAIELESNQTAPALLFPFHLHFAQEEIDYFFLVERDSDSSFLRITVERASDSRLNLQQITHRVVDDLDRRTYIEGLTRIAESFYYGIQRECENFRNEYSENSRRNLLLFTQLRRAGIEECSSVTVRWPMNRTEYLLRAPHASVISFTKKLFLLLEDRDIVARLHAGDTIEMLSGLVRAYLDLSRRGQCLNISLEHTRAAPSVNDYLDRMPLLAEVGRRNAGDLTGFDVFLVHHITSEILATIRALSELGCERLDVLFVKYAGLVPAEYLEALLSLPDDRFYFSGLQKIESADSIHDYYLLSRQYSLTNGLDRLDQLLSERRLGYFDAMQLVAGHLFFRRAFSCQRLKRPILLVEDGGYLAPLLNRYALDGWSLAQALEQFGFDTSIDEFNSLTDAPTAAELSTPLAAWLTEILPGSVEHTRNGYNRLEEVVRDYGQLQFPALSIAISDLKRDMESEEVSTSIIHAIESILNGQGLVLSRRRALVIGSSGAIGRNLMEDLTARIGTDGVIGVDPVLAMRENREWATLSEVPHKELLNSDIILGVVGESTLDEIYLTELLFHSKRPAIFFASGSTKTVEFTHLSNWIAKINEEGCVAGKIVHLEVSPIRDPQTALIQGNRIRFYYNGERLRDLYLLGGLTPINFLYYGVPTETMDPVLAQLLEVTAGLARHSKDKTNYYNPITLMAVDHQIDPQANMKL